MKGSLWKYFPSKWWCNISPKLDITLCLKKHWLWFLRIAIYDFNFFGHNSFLVLKSKMIQIIWSLDLRVKLGSWPSFQVLDQRQTEWTRMYQLHTCILGVLIKTNNYDEKIWCTLFLFFQIITEFNILCGQIGIEEF